MRSTPPPFRLALFLVPIFMAVGVHLPFWPIWLAEHGASNSEIGEMLASALLVRVLIPVIVQRVDETGRSRRAVIVATAASAFVFAGFAFARGYWALLGLCALFGACMAIVFLLADALTSAVVRDHYGRVRLWGSAAFMGTALGAGLVLDANPIAWAYWMVLGSLALALVAARWLPDPPHDPAPRAAGPRPLRALLKNRGFVLLVIGASLVQASHAGVYSFGSLHWKAHAVDEGTIGALWSTGVIAEIALFSVGARAVASLGPLGLVGIGGVAAVARWCVLASTTEVPVLFCAQVLHAATFAGTHLGFVAFVAKRVPTGQRVTAQAVYATTGTGIAMGGATLAAGRVFEAHGGAVFWVMAGIAVAGALTVAAASIATRRGAR